MPRKSTKNVEEVVEREPAFYELGYLFIPSIAQAELGNKVEEIRSILTQNGSQITDVREPEMRDLAYEMNHKIENVRKNYDTAYFGWMNFKVSPDSLSAIDAALMANNSVLRFMIIKKDEVISKPADLKAKGEHKEEIVDQAIDELVTE